MFDKILDAMNPFKFPWDIKPGINPLFDSPAVEVPGLGKLHLFNPLTHGIATLIHASTVLPITIAAQNVVISAAFSIGGVPMGIAVAGGCVILVTLVNMSTYRAVAVVTHEVLKMLVPLPFGLSAFL